MRYPEFLPENGTIGFLAPSFGCATEPYKSAFENSLKMWERAGFNTKLGPNCFEGRGVGISNLPEECGKEVNASFEDEASDVLIPCGGGELMCEILDYVDFEKIKANVPKWFMGYSDNTNLTFLLPTICDTAAIYGPCAASFGCEPMDKSLRDSIELLQGKKLNQNAYELWEKEQLKSEDNPLCGYNLTEKRIHKLFDGQKWVDDCEFKFEGRLLGGCLDCLINLAGTKYDNVKAFNDKYQGDGIIWFLEACDLNVFSIRRAMWQLDHAGWFKNVKGFLIGRPRISEEIMGLDVYNAFLEMLRKYQVPVIMDMDIGHMPPMMPIISGGYGKVSVSGNDLELSMELK